MEFKSVLGPLGEVEADALVMLVFSDAEPVAELKTLDEKMGGQITKLIKEGEISGKYREFTLIHTDKIKPSKVLVMGLGKKSEFDVDRIRSMAGRSARILRRINTKKIAYSSYTDFGISPELAAMCISEGVMLGLYHFKKYITTRESKEPVERVIVVAKDKDEVEPIKVGLDKGTVLAESTITARNLVNEPANIMNPRHFAGHALEIAQKYGLQYEVLDENDMTKMGMGALMAVAKGSDEPPRMVILKHLPNPGAPVLALIGKGITFDSGGLCLKSDESMHRMYDDCSGACAVLGAMSAIARLKIKLNVIGIMPMAENMPSGNAFRPGDIIKSMLGKTIEIISTDAEGRLLLADALTLAQRMNAEMLIDIATLTGGCVTALGHVASGIIGNNDELIAAVKKAGSLAAENMWQLPLFPDYFAQIHSDVADMENSGGRAGSPCTAAKFLEQFIEGRPWVHIDIAGTAMIERERAPYTKKPYLPKEGGTGVGVRTMTHLAELLSEKYAK